MQRLQSQYSQYGIQVNPRPYRPVLTSDRGLLLWGLPSGLVLQWPGCWEVRGKNNFVTTTKSVSHASLWREKYSFLSNKCACIREDETTFRGGSQAVFSTLVTNKQNVTMYLVKKIRNSILFLGIVPIYWEEKFFIQKIRRNPKEIQIILSIYFF